MTGASPEYSHLYDEIDDLKTINTDLLAALEAVVRFLEAATDYEATHPFEYASPLKARAAIAKARRES